MKETKLSKKRKQDRQELPKSIEDAAESSSKLKDGWQKVGEGMDQMSFGEDGLVIRAGNTSITSDADGTKMVPGKELRTKVQSPTDIKYDTPQGTRAKHPRDFSEGFSSAAFPKPSTISSPDTDLLTLIDMVDKIKEIMSIL